MNDTWDPNQPLYRQFYARVVTMILEEALKDGDPLPSLRSVAAEHRVNPLTVMKSYQQLADEGLVEKRRGLGMFVVAGARQALLKGERGRFLDEEWPRTVARIRQLGLSVEELLEHVSGAAPARKARSANK